MRRLAEIIETFPYKPRGAKPALLIVAPPPAWQDQMVCRRRAAALPNPKGWRRFNQKLSKEIVARFSMLARLRQRHPSMACISARRQRLPSARRWRCLFVPFSTDPPALTEERQPDRTAKVTICGWHQKGGNMKHFIAAAALGALLSSVSPFWRWPIRRRTSWWWQPP